MPNMSARNNEPTGWVGWVYFASLMMLVLGGLQLLSGLVALLKDDFYAVGENGLVFFNYTAWGWINIVMGVIVIAAAMAVSSGRMWGRIVASLLVVLSAI